MSAAHLSGTTWGEPSVLLAGLEKYGAAAELHALALQHFTTALDVLGHSRRANIVAARRAFVLALRARHLSWPVIGDLVGRDHTSVMVLARPLEERRQREVRR